MDILDIVVNPDTIVAETDQELTVGEVQVSATEPFTGWVDLLNNAGGRFLLNDNRLVTTRFQPAGPGDYTIRILASTQSGLGDTFDPGVSFEKDIVIHVVQPFQTITGISVDTTSFVADGLEKKVATIEVAMDAGTLGNRSRNLNTGSTAWLELRQSPDVADFDIPDLAPGQPVGPRNNELWVRRGVDEARNYTLRLRANWNGALNTPFRQTVEISATEPPTSDLMTFFAGMVPTVIGAADPYPVELGVQFIPRIGGGVIGLRFYKSRDNVGPHFGHLWDGDGNLISSLEFTGGSLEGWQQRNFGGPITMLTAGQTYVASYHTPSGHYSMTENFFVNPHTDFTGRLVAPASDTIERGNGVFVYGDTPGVFPTNTWSASNYYVDILFIPQGAGPPP